MSGGAPAVVAPYEDSVLWDAVGRALRPGGLALTEHAVGLCGFVPGARLLDIGCGLGASAAYLAGQGVAVAGVEPSPALLKEAGRCCPQADLRAGCAEELPFADEAFDGVLMECVLSLVADRRRALNEAARVLRPGGRLVVSDVCRRLESFAPPREGADGATSAGAAAAGWPRAAAARTLAGHGLALQVWEDHAGTLADFVARMVFAGISPNALAGLLGCASGAGTATAAGGGTPVGAGGVPADDDGMAWVGADCAKGAGYFLAIAHKNEAAAGGGAPCRSSQST